MLFQAENKTDPVLPWPLFVRRMAVSLGTGFLLIVASLLVGMWGFEYYENLPWLDAYLNASMLLSGMGPLEQPASPGGKVFAGLYALYSGFAVLVIAGVAFGPAVHRVLHKLHADESDIDECSVKPPERR